MRFENRGLEAKTSINKASKKRKGEPGVNEEVENDETIVLIDSAENQPSESSDDDSDIESDDDDIGVDELARHLKADSFS